METLKGGPLLITCTRLRMGQAVPVFYLYFMFSFSFQLFILARVFNFYLVPLNVYEFYKRVLSCITAILFLRFWLVGWLGGISKGERSEY